MIASFIQSGDAIDYTPTTDTPAGSVVVQRDLVGVTKLDIKAGQRGSLHLAGVFTFPKEVGSGEDLPAGTEVFWDVGEQVVRTTRRGGNRRLGKTVAAAADNDPTVQVRLSQ